MALLCPSGHVPDAIGPDGGHCLECGPFLREQARIVTKVLADTHTPAPGSVNGTEPRLETFHLTDLGNAKRLAARHGKDLRYCYPAKVWYWWTGRRWAEDTSGEVHRRAKEAVTSIYTEAAAEPDASLREALAKHAVKSESESRIAAMVELAKSEPGLQVQPTDLDAHPWLLNCPNGTLDLRTGKLRPHRREDYLTKMAAAPYIPDARLDLWDDFVIDIADADVQLAAFLQRAVGASLSGEAIELFFFAHGPKQTGKTTFLEAVGATLGDYAATADFETFLVRDRVSAGPRSDLVRLRGRRFVKSVEVADGRKLATGVVKMLTGGDTVAFRSLFATEIEFKPSFTLWLAANDAPRVPDDDDALWRRMVRIPFNHTFENPDPNIKAKLVNPGMAGAAILRWAVEGCVRWQQEGLDLPKSVKTSTEAYRLESNPLADFFADRCLVMNGLEVQAANLFKAYEDWAIERGTREHNRLNSTAFGRKLGKLFQKESREDAKYYLGIGLRA